MRDPSKRPVELSWHMGDGHDYDREWLLRHSNEAVRQEHERLHAIGRADHDHERDEVF